MRTAPVEIIQFLADNSPRALVMPNKRNERPIHLACRSNPNVDVMQYLVNRSPKSLHTRDSKFNLPLHVACAQRASLDVIRVLMQAYPEGLLYVKWPFWLVGCFRLLW
jgi:ankyrin repeat protein